MKFLLLKWLHDIWKNIRRRRKKRDRYNQYTQQERDLIGKYAAEHGNTKAAVYYSQILNKVISESSARMFKKRYIKYAKFKK
ncbi:uncharacterized protein LOC143228924 isoform X2 [Tachypleus tridentatus]|uniref:uncharacterized protein LOC143228924 isoform X2 n=1 Tax=Tachypleus tridentatus TaxID=6853 RepID=UPI003FD55347